MSGTGTLRVKDLLIISSAILLYMLMISPSAPNDLLMISSVILLYMLMISPSAPNEIGLDLRQEHELAFELGLGL